MLQLLNKNLKRILCVFFAAIMLFMSLFMFASCESSKPKITMKLEFDNTTYTLTYTLHRKFFPQTVKHFIELVDSGYYNGLCFHHYTEDGMYTGAYEYDATASGNHHLKERDYFDYLTANDVKLTQTVFGDVVNGQKPTATQGLNTVAGEFSANGYEIENNEKNYGAKRSGALVMYYNEFEGNKLDDPYITTKRHTANNGVKGDAKWYDYSNKKYSMNCATSQFFVSFTSDENTICANYAVFAYLEDEDAEEEYDKMADAVAAYAEKHYSEDTSAFTQEANNMPAFSENDPYYASLNLTTTYMVPEEPIIIRSIKVNRY